MKDDAETNWQISDPKTWRSDDGNPGIYLVVLDSAEFTGSYLIVAKRMTVDVLANETVDDWTALHDEILKVAASVSLNEKS